MNLSVHDHIDLQDSPIPAAWVLDGQPVARVKPLASTGPRTQVSLWDCTRGSFDWQFGPFDETVLILEGEVTVSSEDGGEHVLRAGDTALFAARTTSRWVVEDYVKKVAVLHDTRSRGRRFLELARAAVRSRCRRRS